MYSHPFSGKHTSAALLLCTLLKTNRPDGTFRVRVEVSVFELLFHGWNGDGFSHINIGLTNIYIYKKELPQICMSLFNVYFLKCQLNYFYLFSSSLSLSLHILYIPTQQHGSADLARNSVAQVDRSRVQRVSTEAADTSACLISPGN